MDFSEVKVPLTMKQVDCLYWLGRYSERALTTLRIFMRVYDSMLDTDFDYEDYCRRLDIYNGFSSLEDFCDRYAFDEQYQSSITSSLRYADGNAMMVRDLVGSEALSYQEMALRTLLDAKTSRSPVLLFQRVIDCIMAFRGTVEDSVMDRNVRNIILCGHSVERLDIYLRLGIHEDKVLFESRRLAEELAYTDVEWDSLQMAKITGDLCEKDAFLDRTDKMLLIQLVDSMFAFS